MCIVLRSFYNRKRPRYIRLPIIGERGLFAKIKESGYGNDVAINVHLDPLCRKHPTIVATTHPRWRYCSWEAYGIDFLYALGLVEIN